MLQGYSGSLPSMAAAAAAAIDAVPAANGSLLPILLNMLKNVSALVLMCLVMWRRILLFVRAVPSDLAETPCAGLNLNLIHGPAEYCRNRRESQAGAACRPRVLFSSPIL